MNDWSMTIGSLAGDAGSKKHKGAFLILLLAAYSLWIGLVLIGHLVLFEYEMTASPLADTRRIFPEKSTIQLAHGRQNIVMFLHPMCPCSLSSVDEFRELMRSGQKDLLGTVVAYMPRDQEAEWSLQPVFSSLKRIRNVSVVYDIDGVQTKLFGATTSGHVLIYDGRGILQFTGGITDSRGHTGDNANYELAKKTIVARNPKFTTAPVYGCALR